jgi:hypothetical protein
LKGSHKIVLSEPSQGSLQRLVQKVAVAPPQGLEIIKLFLDFTHAIFHINSRKLLRQLLATKILEKENLNFFELDEVDHQTQYSSL